MRYFFRSLRYLWPYRVRVGLGLGCGLLISVLWAGGLAAILPGAKLLLSQEGLHGWAYNARNSNRLDLQLAQRLTPSDFRVEGQSLSWVLEISRVKAGGRADRAGLCPGQWIVGVGDGDASHRLLRADVLSRLLASAPDDKPIAMRVTVSGGQEVQTVVVVPGEPDLAARALGWAAGLFREPRSYPDRFPILLALLAAAVAMTLIRNGLRIIQGFLSNSAVLLALNDLRRDSFGTVLCLPVSYFARHGTTDLTSRLMKDMNLLSQGQIVLLGKTLLEPAKAVACLFVAMLLSWKLTLMAMLAGPPAFLAVRWLTKAMRRMAKRTLEGSAEMLHVIQEALTGIRVVKAYTMENTERRRFTRVNVRLLRQQLKTLVLDSAVGPAVEAIGTVSAMASVAVAGYWVLNGLNGMDAETLLALLACLAAMFDPIRRLSSVSATLSSADAAAERIFEVQTLSPEVVEPGAAGLPRHRDRIEFRGVSFRYEGATDWALRGVDLQVRAGETVAIVGPNGSGKTTLVSLLPRLLDPTEGSVWIDGRDIAHCSLRALRKQIGLVSQDGVLFHATIEENIAYGLRRPGRERVRDAARRADVDEFVQRLPEGYGTMVGQHGATLSGGEKQRIAIARAILRDPAILIFDEASSQIDSESERRIFRALEEFRRGRTVFVVAHRLSTVMSADRIVVMQAGGIIDVGRHEEVLGRCELYRTLCSTQFISAGKAQSVM